MWMGLGMGWSRVWSLKYTQKSLNKPIRFILVRVLNFPFTSYVVRVQVPVSPSSIDVPNRLGVSPLTGRSLHSVDWSETFMCQAFPMLNYNRFLHIDGSSVNQWRHALKSSIDTTKAVSRQPLGPSCGPFCGALEKSYPNFSNVNMNIDKSRTSHTSFTQKSHMKHVQTF